MEKDKRPQSPGNPPQDVDDLIFSGQTDARISQRFFHPLAGRGP